MTDSTSEEFYDFWDDADVEKFKGYDFPKPPAGRAPTEWTDQVIKDRVKGISLPDLRELPARRALTHKVLQFFLTGTAAYSSAPALLTHFIASFDWFKEFGEQGKPGQPIYEALVDGGAAVDPLQTVGDAPSLETVLQGFAQRLKTEKVVRIKGKRKRLRGRVRAKPPGDDTLYNLVTGENGPSHISREHLLQKVKRYYEYVDLYFDEVAREHPSEARIPVTFVRSLFLLALICFRSRAKHPESVKNYILTGGYDRLMRKLLCFLWIFDDHRHDLDTFEVSPVTEGFMDLLQGFYNPNPTSVELAVILIYCHCKMKFGLGERCVVDANEEVPAKATLDYDRQQLLHVLEGGCMQHLQFKGLTVVELVEQFLRTESLKTLAKINTTRTTEVFAKSYAVLLSSQPAWHPRPDGKYDYTSWQRTWIYSRCVDETAFIDLANNSNAQYIWRLLSVLAIDDEAYDPAKFKNVRYKPTEADEKYLDDSKRRLNKIREEEFNFKELLQI